MIRIPNVRAPESPLAGIGLVLICAIAQWAQAEEIRLEPYSVPDQFDVVHTADEVQDSVVVFFRTDRKSYQYNREWLQAINAD